MEAMIRGLIGEARAKDQQRIGELTAKVQRMQQARDAPAVATAQNILETGKAASLPRRRGSVARLQFSCVHPVHGRYPELVAAVEDPAQGSMTMANWAPEQSQVSRQLYLILVLLTEEAALRIVQALHDSNGAEALRLLYRRCNPLTQGQVERGATGGLRHRRTCPHGPGCAVGVANL